MDTDEPISDDTVVLERAVLWGETWPLDRPARTLRFGETRVEAVRLSDTVLRLEESGRPPMIVGLGAGGGRLAYGHIRRTRPLLLRFPRPLRIAARMTLPVFSTYPIQPALFYEAPDGARMKLLDLPVRPLPKTLYGRPDDGVLCDLHYGPAEIAAEAIRADRLHGIVQVRLVNRSPEPRETGIVMIDVPALDFFVLDGRLCINVIELRVISPTVGDLEYIREPSLPGARLVDARLRETSPNVAGEFLRMVLGHRDMEGGL